MSQQPRDSIAASRWKDPSERALPEATATSVGKQAYRLRGTVSLCGFRLHCEVVGTIFSARQVQEKLLEQKRDFGLASAKLTKA